jgi:pyruvate formate lyase activating enzyme
MQPAFLGACIDACKARGFHVAVDTTCHCDRADLLGIAESADLFLCDLKHMDPGRHRELTGADNQILLANMRALSERGSAMILRIPLIGGYNDELDNMRQSAELARELKSVQRVDLLPYNAGGLAKAERLAEPTRQVRARALTEDQMARITGLFEQRGLTVVIEG